MHGKPETWKDAVRDAREIEYAMDFKAEGRKQQDINAVHQKPTEIQPVATQDDSKQVARLQETLEKFMQRMEVMETKLEAMTMESRRNSQSNPYNSSYQRPSGRGRGGRRQVCWLCQEEGHFKNTCPLNYKGPVRSVGDWPKNQ